MQTLPIILATAFFFYIAVTTIGIPVFLAIAEIDNAVLRRFIGYSTIAIMLFATFYSLMHSPVFDVLPVYVGKLFPAAYECKDSLLEIS